MRFGAFPHGCKVTVSSLIVPVRSLLSFKKNLFLFTSNGFLPTQILDVYFLDEIIVMLKDLSRETSALLKGKGAALDDDVSVNGMEGLLVSKS